eukprot:3717629-Rhodomonas_salina.2
MQKATRHTERCQTAVKDSDNIIRELRVGLTVAAMDVGLTVAAMDVGLGQGASPRIARLAGARQPGERRSEPRSLGSTSPS